MRPGLGYGQVSLCLGGVRSTALLPRVRVEGGAGAHTEV